MWVGWGLLGSGLALLVSGIVAFVVIEGRSNDLLAHGTRVQGVVIGSYPSDWWNVGSVDYAGNLDVRFRTADGPVIARIYTNSDPTPRVGQRYTVIYDPDHPTIARGLGDDMNERPQWMGGPVLLSWLIGPVLAAIGVVSAIRTRRRAVLITYRGLEAEDACVPLRLGRMRWGLLVVTPEAIRVHAPRTPLDGISVPRSNVTLAVPGDPDLDDHGEDWMFEPLLDFLPVGTAARTGGNVWILFADPVDLGERRVDGVDLDVPPREWNRTVERFRTCDYEITTRPAGWLIARRTIVRDQERLEAFDGAVRRARWTWYLSWIPIALTVLANILDDITMWALVIASWALLVIMLGLNRRIDRRNNVDLTRK